jgi:hypothetical protein
MKRKKNDKGQRPLKILAPKRKRRNETPATFDFEITKVEAFFN